MAKKRIKTSDFLKLIYYLVAVSITIYGLWTAYEQNFVKWLPLVYIIASLVVFGLYERDKLAAKNRMWRIPESTLHFFELIGGWVGAFWAQFLFRHKTRKISYQITFWVIVTLHVAFWTDYAFFNLHGLSSVLQMIDGDFSSVKNLLPKTGNSPVNGTIEWSNPR